MCIRDRMVTVLGETEQGILPQGARPGINYLNDTQATLVLQAPGKRTVYVVGDFNDWQFKSEYHLKQDGEFFWITLSDLEKGKEYAFQYVVCLLYTSLGSMMNEGVEFSVTAIPLKKKDMELTVSANFSWQRNELLSLDGTYNGQPLSAEKYMSLASMNGAGFIGVNNKVVYQMVGQPVGVFYLPKSDGLVDKEGNGV